MKSWFSFLVTVFLLSGCASPAVPPPPSSLFNNQLFDAPATRISRDDVFALSPQMKAYLDTPALRQGHMRNPQKALFDALYGKGQLKLEYDSTMTRNAAQTFDAGIGNCLSLVIMTAAFAKEMGLVVQYNNVLSEETWSRNGTLHFAVGHVNLTLGKRSFPARGNVDMMDLTTIDFLPPEDAARVRSRPIPESTVVAMYMNNRAAELLAEGKLDDAYWWAREAIHQDPGFLGSYNTLGVIYQRNNNPDEAERALSHVLKHDSRNTIAMHNLAQLLVATGRDAEARALTARLRRLEPDPPFHFFYQGMASMRRGDFVAAKTLFARELARDPTNPEVQFWLASAHMRLGELHQARRHLARAVEYSTTQKSRELYAAKLDQIMRSTLQ